MANQEQLGILKLSVKVWNQWRRKNPGVQIDLSGAYLSSTHLRYADLKDAYLSSADLSSATLRDANLYGATLTLADLSNADLRDAYLGLADLSNAILRDADLRGAHFPRATLRDADLSSADLSNADLGGADLYDANLSDANLSDANIGSTVFGNVDLSVVKGLETVRHLRPSTVGIDTIIRSKGKIPKIFLRKAGVPDAIIEAIPSLIGSLEPIQYYTCFISYSSKDQDFAKRLYADLQREKVRCWFAPEDMDIGDKIRPRIEESIRRYDKLLLVLSEYSIASNWVAYEVERALNKEPEGVPNVLYPIRLDDAVMKTKAGWADDIRRTRHIGDFTHWKNHDDYQKAFNRLLHALKAEAQKMESRDGTTNGG